MRVIEFARFHSTIYTSTLCARTHIHRSPVSMSQRPKICKAKHSPLFYQSIIQSNCLWGECLHELSVISLRAQPTDWCNCDLTNEETIYESIDADAMPESCCYWDELVSNIINFDFGDVGIVNICARAWPHERKFTTELTRPTIWWKYRNHTNTRIAERRLVFREIVALHRVRVSKIDNERSQVESMER